MNIQPIPQSGATRSGNFSNSSIWKLMTLATNKKDFGKPALTYIKQKRFERKLGRSINKETNARATSWGWLAEKYAFDILPLDYKLVSTDRLVHPEIPTWTGACDLMKQSTLAEVKSPFSLEVFCEKIEALQSGIETYKKEFPEDYWQGIGGAILLEKNGFPVTHFEPIIFCPYKDELDKIRQMAMDAPPEEAAKYRWLDYAYDNELPYLKNGGEYDHLNIYRFEIPQADKDALTEAVLRAEKMIGGPQVIIAEEKDGITIISKG